MYVDLIPIQQHSDFPFSGTRADVVATFAFCGVPGRFQKSMKDWVCAIVLSCGFHKGKRLRRALPEDAGGQSEVDQCFFCFSFI